MFFRPEPVHFTGIGGIGMSGLAEILLRSGFPVSGSDLRLSAVTSRLAGLGARIVEGHEAANVGEASFVVATSAARETNPELAEARRRGLPVVKRGELLAELMRDRYGIAVGGSHGKTTTTAMLAAVLMEAGLDPTVVVGGILPSLGSNARLGKSAYFVAESDESDGSFLLLQPIVAVITNIDREHLDHYAGLEAIRDAFIEFANRTPFYGAVVLCLDDAAARSIVGSIHRPLVTYGRSAEADYTIRGERSGRDGSEFVVAYKGRELGRFELPSAAPHNVLNATAAIAAGRFLGIEDGPIRRALANFQGVGRRFEVRGEAAGVTVVDDYGHHPTEIRATLEGARAAGYGRVRVIFQPHRYTRTAALMEEFACCFEGADEVFVLDVYAASEQPMEGVSGERLAGRVPGASYAASFEEAVRMVVESARPGDLVITQGAGNVREAGDRLLAALRQRN